MILVADSGSTKCDWLSFDKNTMAKPFSTAGFNPFFWSTEGIVEEIRKSNALTEISQKVEHIYFFGAGCSSNERNTIISFALNICFPNAKVLVEHDLLGAAYASCGNHKGIACILGTGSNSCYFDGKDVHEVIPSLGYILGDEGGGDSIGKKMLTKYLYHQLPDYLNNRLKNDLKLTKESIFEAVYKKPNANVFMASITRELADFKNEPFVQNFVGENLREFLEIHVLCYDNYKEVRVNFIGSVAYSFQEILHSEAKKLGITIGSIKKTPIEALKDFYFEKHFDKK